MHLRLLLWSLRQRRARHAQNVLTLAITVAVMMVFISVLVELMAFVNVSASSGLSRIILTPTIQQPDSRGLPTTIGTILKGIPGVKTAQCYKAFSGKHPSGARYSIVGEEESGLRLNADFFPVEPAVIDAWMKERPTGAIVAEATAKELDIQVGETLELPTPRGPITLKFVGISKGGLFAHRIAAHIDYVQEFTKETGLCWYRVFSAPEDFDKVVREIVERTKTTSTPMQAFSDAQLTRDIVKQAAFIPVLLGFLGLFLLLTTALTLANSAAISIRERRIETATLRVIGFERRTILGLLILEGLLVGLLGAVIAIVVTSILFKNGVQLTPGGFRVLQAVKIGKAGIIGGVVIAVVIPLLGIVPTALVSLRMKLVDALRDVA